jgi:antitoxin PrlF
MKATRSRRKHSALTRKGQITLPKTLRDALGWTAGTRLTFVQERDGIKVIATGEDHPGEALVRRSLGIASTTVTTDQMIRMTRGED